MAKEKIKVMVRGKMLELSSVAFEIARDYFGAQKVSELVSTKPIELSKPIMIPKLQVKVEKPVELNGTIEKTITVNASDLNPMPGARMVPIEGEEIEDGSISTLQKEAKVKAVVKKPATRKKK